jgi:hypothetical protein
MSQAPRTIGTGAADVLRRRGEQMKRVLVAALVLSTLVVTAGCGAGGTAGDAEHGQAAVQDSALFVERADAAATGLAQTLGGRLTASLSEGGVAHAIDFCAGTALPLTDSVAAVHGVDLKRVSERTRNPSNTPDAEDRLAILAMDSIMRESGSPPAFRLQRTADGGLRYYRPLMIGAMCVQCHGPAEALSPDVARVLRARYPDDEATGYEEGDLRGVIRVAAPGR